MGQTLDRLFNPGGGDPPDITELIQALVDGDPGDEPQQDPLSIERSAGARQSEHASEDEDGFIHGRAAEFATSKDLHDFATNRSLKTGDNGVGAWGDNTAGATPGVAVPRNWLAKKYGNENAAKGKMVQIIAPNGTTATVPILDKGPAAQNRANNAVIEVNPAAKKLLGAGDSNGWRYRLLD